MKHDHWRESCSPLGIGEINVGTKFNNLSRWFLLSTEERENKALLQTAKHFDVLVNVLLSTIVPATFFRDVLAGSIRTAGWLLLLLIIFIILLITAFLLLMPQTTACLSAKSQQRPYLT